MIPNLIDSIELIFSQEEIESLRERMSAQTSLVVIGSADDALRINKFNRHLEGVTQSMVDNMVAVCMQKHYSSLSKRE